MYFQSSFFFFLSFYPFFFASLRWSVSVQRHPSLCGKHDSETNRSQVSAHWSSVISHELMAPLNEQQGSLGNISMWLRYRSCPPPPASKNPSGGCQKKTKKTLQHNTTFWKSGEKPQTVGRLQELLCYLFPFQHKSMMIQNTSTTSKIIAINLLNWYFYSRRRKTNWGYIVFTLKHYFLMDSISLLGDF